MLNTHRRRRCADPTCMLCTRCVGLGPRLSLGFAPRGTFRSCFCLFFVLSLKSGSSVNTIYRNFICGPQAVQAQLGIIYSFSEFICLTGVSQRYHCSDRTPSLPGLAYPPKFLMLMSCMAGRCDYFPRHTTNRRQIICHYIDVHV